MGVGSAINIRMAVNSSGVKSGLRKVFTELRGLERVAKKAMVAARTPAQQYAATVAKLTGLLSSTTITQKVFNDSLKNAKIIHSSATAKIKAQEAVVRQLAITTKLAAEASRKDAVAKKAAGLVTSELAAIQRQAAAIVAKSISPVQKYNITISRLNALLKTSAITQKQFASATAQAGVILRATAPAAKKTAFSIASVGKAAVGAAGAIAGLKASLAGLSVFLGPVAAIFAAFRVGANVEEFNRAMNSSLAIMKNVSAEMRNVMEKTAFDVARMVRASASEAAESYFFLASAGLDAVQSIKALPVVATFAQAGMFDMATATDLLTDAQSALGLSVKDPIQNMKNMARVGNVLVKANTLANASVRQFSEALTTKAGAAMRNLNVEIEEGVATLATFADQGAKAGIAGTGLAIVLRDITTKSIRFKEKFKDLNIEGAFGKDEQFRGPIAAILSLENALKKMTPELQKATLLTLGFADRSVAFIQQLIGNSEKTEDFRSALEDAGDTMQSVAETQMTPLERGIQSLSSSFTEFTVEMEKSFKVLERLGGFLEGLGDIFETLADGMDIVELSLLNIMRTAAKARIALGIGDIGQARELLFGVEARMQEIVVKRTVEFIGANLPRPVPVITPPEDVSASTFEMLAERERAAARRKEDERLTKLGERFRNTIKTPLERFAEVVGQIREAEAGDKLSAAEAAMAIALERETAVSAFQRELPKEREIALQTGSAKIAGSQEFVNAILQNRFRSTDPAQLERKKQTKELEGINERLDAIEDKIEPDARVEIQPK